MDVVLEEFSWSVRITLVLFPAFMLITVPIRLIIKKTNCVISQPFVFYSLGLCVGLGVTKFLGPIPGNQVYTLHPARLLDAYVPLYIFTTLYAVDYFTLKMCRWQIAIMALMDLALSSVVLALLFKITLHPGWSYQTTFLMVLACVPIKTKYVIAAFSELSKHKYMSTVIEGESLLSSVVVVVVYKYAYRVDDGKVDAAPEWVVAWLLYYIAVGVVFGAIMGKLVSLFMYVYYNDSQKIIATATLGAYITYSAAQDVLAASGELAVVLYAYLVAINRYKLTAETDANQERFIGFTYYTLTHLCMGFSVIEISRYFWMEVFVARSFGVIITYFSATFSRLLSFAAMSFILHNFTYYINTRCLIILGWAGVKGVLNILLVMTMFLRDESVARECVVEATVYMAMSLLINGSTMQVAMQLVGLTQMGGSRKANMFKCLQIVMDKRNVVIKLFKYNRYLTNTNWLFVRNLTSVMEKFKSLTKNDVEDRDSIAYGIHICPICFKEMEIELSTEEFHQLLIKARAEILNAKRSLIVKQYESGIISKNCWQVLEHYLGLMIELNVKMEHVDLKQYFKKDKYTVLFKNYLQSLAKKPEPIPPSSPLQRFFFYLVSNVYYEYVHCAIIAAVFFASLFLFIYLEYRYFHIHIFICVVFILHVAISMLALTKLLFSHFWYVFDLIVLLARLIELILSYKLSGKGVCISDVIISAVHLLRFVSLLGAMQETIVEYLDYKIDMKSCFAYDLATILVNCIDDILENLSDYVEMHSIKELQIKRLLAERVAFIKRMEEVQKERPWVAITVKTKQAIRTTLTVMQDALNQIASSGFVDEPEFVLINKDLLGKQKYLRQIKFVESSSPISLFKEIQWMGNDESLVEYLFKNAKTVKWNAGDIIVKEGKVSGGVYIIISGILQLTYEPNVLAIEKHKKFGNIPVIDYISNCHFEQTFVDTIMPGNSFGELCLLTERPYDCTIVATAEGEAYFLEHSVVKNAMRRHFEKINSLEARMWKHSTINLIVQVLMETAAYQSLTQEQINGKIEKGFMPNLRCFKMFVVNENVEDVVLVEGIAADFSDSRIYRAPIIIPKTVLRIILPRSSYLAMGEMVQTKLFVIPFGKATEYEVMEHELEIAQLESLKLPDCSDHEPPETRKSTKSISKNRNP